MLEAEQLEVYYGNLRILRRFSFRVKSGEITTIVGSNGAGKSTTLKAVAGFVPVASGKLSFGDTDITGMKPYQIVDLGLSLVDEGIKLFPLHDGFGKPDSGRVPKQRLGRQEKNPGAGLCAVP